MFDDQTPEPDLSEVNLYTVGQITDLGIYSTPSDDWETDKDTICANLDSGTCQAYRE